MAIKYVSPNIKVDLYAKGLAALLSGYPIALDQLCETTSHDV